MRRGAQVQATQGRWAGSQGCVLVHGWVSAGAGTQALARTRRRNGNVYQLATGTAAHHQSSSGSAAHLPESVRILQSGRPPTCRPPAWGRPRWRPERWGARRAPSAARRTQTAPPSACAGRGARGGRGVNSGGGGAGVRRQQQAQAQCACRGAAEPHGSGSQAKEGSREGSQSSVEGRGRGGRSLDRGQVGADVEHVVLQAQQVHSNLQPGEFQIEKTVFNLENGFKLRKQFQIEKTV